MSLDELTGLPNKEDTKRVATQLLIEQVKSTTSDSEQHSIILCDIDYFKAINDLFSHSVGDTIIQCTSQQLQEYWQQQKNLVGVIGRWGGEEFLLSLPYKTSTETEDLAEGFRRKIREYEFNVEYRCERLLLRDYLTISFGVNTLDIAEVIRNQAGILDEKRVWRLLKKEIDKADVALEYAKILGRDRVEVFCDNLEKELSHIETVRHYYFTNSYQPLDESRKILRDYRSERFKKELERVFNHFIIIQQEVSSKDTRTQALFADNTYRTIREREEDKVIFTSLLRDFTR